MGGREQRSIGCDREIKAPRLVISIIELYLACVVIQVPVLVDGGDDSS